LGKRREERKGEKKKSKAYSTVSLPTKDFFFFLGVSFVRNKEIERWGHLVGSQN
jgi:hypothetical protein